MDPFCLVSAVQTGSGGIMVWGIYFHTERIIPDLKPDFSVLGGYVQNTHAKYKPSAVSVTVFFSCSYFYQITNVVSCAFCQINVWKMWLYQAGQTGAAIRRILWWHKKTAEGAHWLQTGKQITIFSFLYCLITYLIWNKMLIKGYLKISFLQTGVLWEGACPSHDQSDSCRGSGAGVAGLYWKAPEQVRK